MYKPEIVTSQKTQKYLELPNYPFRSYIQFGVAKKNKVRPRVTVNYLEGLRNTRNKILQHQLLQDAGISKPKFFRDYREAVKFMEENNIPLVAKRLNHSRGRGMYLLRKPQHIYEANPTILDPSRYYFEEFVVCNREWRVHVTQFEELVSYRKCLLGEVVDDIKENDKSKPWIRNLENCYFKLDSDKDKKPWWDDLIEECKKSLKVLNLDIGAVDIGENTKIDGGKYYIYEVNSAPGMEENTRSHYERGINKIIEQKAQAKGLI